MGYNNHIDLHIHSTASDGTLSPGEILYRAGKAGLGAISITDHDTTSGCREALRIGIPQRVDFLVGVEISTAYPEGFSQPGSLHILGYNFDINDPDISRHLKKLRNARKNRNPAILEILKKLGIPISIKELREIAGNGQLSRPHIAKYLVKKRIVGTINDAFDMYLGTGKIAYVQKYRMNCETAIQMILSAGGTPILAHPGLIKLNPDESMDAFIALLKEKGLRGLEVYYSEHTPEQAAKFKALADQYDLIITGGSDFHGDITPHIQMGSGRGDLSVPYELYKRLLNAKY